MKHITPRPGQDSRRSERQTSLPLPLPSPPNQHAGTPPEKLKDLEAVAAEVKPCHLQKATCLQKQKKLVNGLAKAKPVWLKAMEKSPPAVFPRAEKKVERICLPEDVYVNKFYKKHPESLHEDPIKICDFDLTPSRIFGCRVLELKTQGVSEEDAIDLADTEYRLQRKAKKKAYKRLKEIARIRGTKPPANPYPSAVKEIQAEEKKYVRDRFFNPRILEIAEKLKEQQAAEMQDRGRAGGM